MVQFIDNQLLDQIQRKFYQFDFSKLQIIFQDLDFMNSFQAKSRFQKLASDLTVNSVMNSSSKYLQSGPVPVGQHQPPRNIQHNQRYGSNRRVNKFQGKNHIGNTTVMNSQFQTVASEQKLTQNITKIIQQTKPQSKLSPFLTKQKVLKTQAAQEITSRQQNTKVFMQNSTQNKKYTPVKTIIQAQGKNTKSSTSLNNLNIGDLNSNQTKNSDQTTQTLSNRYGLNRRTQAKKAQEIIQKYQPTTNLSIQITTEKQMLPKSNSQPIWNQIEQTQTPKSNRYQKIKPTDNKKQQFKNEQRRQPYRYATRKIQQNITTPNIKQSKQQISSAIKQTQQKQLKNLQASSRSRIISRTSSQISSPKSVIDKPDFQINQSNKNIPIQPQKTQSKPFTRSTTKVQLKTREQIQLPSNQPYKQITIQTLQIKTRPQQRKAQQKDIIKNPNEIFKIKKNFNIFLFILNKICQNKMKESMDRLQRNYKLLKVKNNNLIKIFVLKLSKIVKLVNTQLCSSVIKKLSKNTSFSMSRLDTKNLQNFKTHKKKILLILLHNIFMQHRNQCFRIIKNKDKIKDNTKLIDVLNKLQKRKIVNYFNEIKTYSTLSITGKLRILVNISMISQKFIKDNLLIPFHKIANHQRFYPQTSQKKQKPSPINDLHKGNITLEASNQKVQKLKIQLQKLQNKYYNNSNNLKKLVDSNKQQISQYSKKIQLLKLSNEDIIQQNWQKKQITQQLKQKANQLKFPQQEYMEHSNMLNETKFYLLSQIYLKIQRSETQNVKVNNLKSYFPQTQKQMNNNYIVESWIEIQHNIWLKKHLARYEGEVQYQKKALKIANKQKKILTQVIIGYIKQKYAWQWVKNALSQISANN